MPKAVVQSSFTQEMAAALQGAHEEHKGDEADYGNVNLPAGIENGVAILNKMEFRKVKEGKKGEGGWEFFASGIVQQPETFNGVKCKGQRTFITEPLFDTPTRTRKTIKEHYAWILNNIRILGVDTKQIEYNQIEQVAAGLVQAQKAFSFQTYKMAKQDIKKGSDGKWYLFALDDNGNPVGEPTAGPYLSEAAGKAQNPYAGREPLTNHKWLGEVAYTNGQSAPGSGLNDNTGQTAVQTATPVSQPVTAPASKPSPAQVAQKPSGAPAVSKPAPQALPQSQAEEAVDLDALAAEASLEGDAGKAARITLVKLSVDHNVAEEVSNADSWAAGAAIIKAAMAGAEAGAAVAGGEVSSNGQWSQDDVGSIYGYPLTDAKTKVTAVGQVEITSFDAATQTVTLKNVTNNKMVMGPNKKPLKVPVGELVAAPE